MEKRESFFKKIKTKAVLGLMALMFASTLIGVTIIHTNATAVNDTEIVYEIKDIAIDYNVGDTLGIPSGKVVVGDKEYKLNHTITYPDGRKSNASKITLDEQGAYTIDYYVTVDGVDYATSKKVNAIFSLNNLFSNVSGANFKYNEKSTNYGDGKDWNYNGVRISFKDKGVSEFKYNGIVNLNDVAQIANKEVFSESESFLDFIVTPDEKGVLEISDIDIRLTDIYDESNYLDIKLYGGTKWGYPNTAYIKTAACEMYDQFSHTNKLVWEDVNGDGTLEYVFSDDMQTSINGSPVATSWVGKYEWYRYKGNSLAYNLKENALYAWNPSSSKAYWELILDYDDQSAVGENYTWNGFTTNEVYVSFKVTTIASNASMIVSSIGGQSLSGEEVLVSEQLNWSLDYSGLEYEINANGNKEYKLPAGYKGCKYKVFDAVAFDDYGMQVQNVNQYVYYTPTNQLVPIVNGYFATNMPGVYRVVYEALYNGEYYTFEQSVNVASTSAPEINYAFDERIQDSYLFGETILLYDAIPSGGVGELTVTKELFVNDIPRKFDNFGSVDLYQTDEVGKVEYYVTIKDMVGQTRVFNKEITVEYIDTPIICGAYIPKVAIVGSTIDFTSVAAYRYEGNVKTDKEVKVFIDGQELQNKQFVPTAKGTVKVKLLVDDYFEEQEIVIKDSEQRYFSDAYFVTDNFNEPVYSGNNTIGFAYRFAVTDVAKESAKLYFANYIPDRTLSLSFGVGYEEGNYKNEFDKVNVYFIDSLDKTSVVKLTVEKATINQKPAAYLYINDEKVGQIAGSFANSKQPFDIVYNYVDYSISDATGKAIGVIKTYANGKAFNGFDSGNVYVEMEVEGCVGTSELKLFRFANNVFSDEKEDICAPQLILKEDFPVLRYGTMGKTIMISSAIGYDVFDGIVGVTCEITSPSGVKIYSGDISEDKYITLSEYGQYSIRYTAKDNSINRQQFRCSIFVNDTKAPTIQAVNLSSTINVGETLNIPKPVVTDDTDQEPKLYVYVYNKDSEQRKLVKMVDGKYQYTFTEAGTYYVRFVAYDQYNNMQVAEYKVIVK